MEILAAAQFIKNAIIKNNVATWADLGCGSGVFTKALATLVDDDSRIYAVDKKLQHFDEPNISFYLLDFEKNKLPFTGLNGILMANSLHYMKDKKNLLQQLQEYVASDGSFVIVEYDTDNANPWVPYPIPFLQLQRLFNSMGYKYVEKVAERNSIFNRAKMYTALVK